MTLNGAKILGIDDQVGAIAPGKVADLVVFEGNPIESASDIRNVTLVFKEGRGYDSPKLIESVEGAVGVR
jgi:imidazolonepropionase-like amidohydrolase